MHPSKFGDTYEMAKICMLRWLEGFEPWGIHPMYFPEPDEQRNEAFPRNYADFLGITCVDGEIGTPGQLGPSRPELAGRPVPRPGHWAMEG